MKLAILEAGHIKRVQAIAYEEETPQQVFISMLDQFSGTHTIVMVHVLGNDFAQAVKALCDTRQVSLHLVIAEKSAYGVTIAYPVPERYGADRFVGVVAAHALYPQVTSVVIDCGTAITLDVVNSAGEHLGGLIYPGIQLCRQSLLQGAKGIADDACVTSGNDLLANDTQLAVANGCLYGAIGAIKAFCESIELQAQEPVQYLLCGGDAKRLSAYLPARFVLRENLLFEGLQLIADQ